jgi:hypothetical protein
MIKLTYILAIISVFYSCNKPSNLTGKVFNVYTGKPIANIYISVKKSPLSFSGEEGSLKLLGQARTDENGNFAINISNKIIKRNSNITCYPYVIINEDSIQEAYMPLNEKGFLTENLNNNASQFVKFPLAPMSRVKFFFKFNSYDIGDSCFITLIDGDFRKRIFKYFSETSKGYCMFLPSNGKILISQDAWKKGVLKQTFDTIFVRPFEKAEHLIVLEKR